MKDKSKHTMVCDNCKEEVRATQQDNYPDNGWWLPYSHFGYYGGFTDEIDVLMGMADGKSLIICHDCIVRMLYFLPALGEAIGKGNHINQNRGKDFQHPLDVKPCCDWCWTSVRDGREPAKIYVVEDGKWVNMREEHTKHAFKPKSDAED